MQLLIHPSQVGCYPVALQQVAGIHSQDEHELMMQVLGQYLQFQFTEICFERNMLIRSPTNKCKEKL